MIEALIFDFDGLIIDSEIPAFYSWQAIYQDYQCDLPLEEWVKCIGGTTAHFDPFVELEARTGYPVPREEIRKKRLAIHHEMLRTRLALPGVETYLDIAHKLDLKVGLASNSSYQWVSGHLARLGLLEKFDYIRTIDHVAHAKPDPALYLATLEGLQVQAENAIALEDSPHGVHAAQQAGIFCVAIPNEVTSRLSLDHADVRLSSMAEMPLQHLIELVEERQRKREAGVV